MLSPGTRGGALLRTIGAQHPRRVVPQVGVFQSFMSSRSAAWHLKFAPAVKPVSESMMQKKKLCCFCNPRDATFPFLRNFPCALFIYLFVYELAVHSTLFICVFFYGQRLLFLNPALCFCVCIVWCVSIQAQGASNSKLMGQN